MSRLSLLVLGLLCSAGLLRGQQASLPLHHQSPQHNALTERAWPQRDAKTVSLQKKLAPYLSLLRSGAIEKLDSVIVEDRDKMVFTFDALGQLKEAAIYFKFFVFGDWEPFFRYTWLYSPQGYVLEEQYWEWSDVLADWEPASKTVIDYLPDGRTLSSIYMQWDESATEWVPDSKTQYTYLPNLKIEQVDYQVWNGSALSWDDHIIGNYHYDAMGRLQEVVREQADLWQNDWYLWEKETYQYDPADLIAQFRTYYWNAASQDWVLSDQYQYTYDAAGLMTEEIYHYYDSWTMDLTPGHRETREYDAHGNLGSSTFSYWESGLGEFVPEDRRVFEYDENITAEQIYFPPIWDGDFIYNHKLLRLRVFAFYAGTWSEQFYAEFHYSPATTSLNQERELALQVYPNPARDHIVLELPQSLDGGMITLFHVSGQAVLRERVGGATTILPIPHIPEGMYVLQFLDDRQGLSTRPLLIHR